MAYKVFRKYIKCFGLLSCDENSTCSLEAECLTECLSNPEKLKKALQQVRNDKRRI
jgi:hypothetical protein